MANQRGTSRSQDSTDLSKFGMGILLREAYFSLRRCSNSICNEHSSNGDQFVVLKYLADEGGLTQSDLVSRSGQDSSTMAAMLRSMQKHGWVTREPHPEDGRAKLVKLTPSGRKLQKRMWEATEEMRETLWKCLSVSECKAVANGLRKIASAMNRFRESTTN